MFGDLSVETTPHVVNVCFNVSLRSDKKLSDVIVVSDEDSPSPDSACTTLNMSKSSDNDRHQLPNDIAGADPNDANVQALRELLQVEEKKLSVLKTIHGLQGGTSTTKSVSSIQGSALNKATGRSSGSGVSGRSSPNLRASQPKHSIVVVPGNQASQLVSSSASTTNNTTGISPRLQELVDSVGVGSALQSKRLVHSTTVGTGKGIPKKLAAVTTPPVPSLTSLSTSKHSIITSNERLLQLTSANNIPPIKPKIITTNRSSSHEIITISDSPVGNKNPPPLLSASTSSLKIPTATSNGSIQVPTISSTLVLNQLSTSGSTGIVKGYSTQHSADITKRYREQILKQAQAKKNFQKQVERKMVAAPYPKTFRQVWPLIPVHDSSFVRNFGLESVMHHFDPNSKAVQEKNNSKVKPICNQCGCDFASAWQIRKSNSKQLLLCEACDFQNLKILQRSKLNNQLKELLDTIKAEKEKFLAECEEVQGRLHDLERKAAESPPPLTSQLMGHAGAITAQKGNSTITMGLVGGATAILSGQQSSNNRYQVVTTQGKQVQAVKGHITNSATNQHHTIVIPSILGQKSESPKQGITNEVVAVGGKRPLAGGQAPTPPSKVYKPGSALDQTLNRLSKQLIKRKLDEQRQECQDTEQTNTDQAVVVVEGDPPPPNSSKEAESMVTSPTSPTFAGQKSKNRRKGTPKHKRHLSASSMNSE